MFPKKKHVNSRMAIKIPEQGNDNFSRHNKHIFDIFMVMLCRKL